MTDDILDRAKPLLNQCPVCDAGLAEACNCRVKYRPVMLDLVREVERLRTECAAAYQRGREAELAVWDKQ